LISYSFMLRFEIGYFHLNDIHFLHQVHDVEDGDWWEGDIEESG